MTTSRQPQPNETAASGSPVSPLPGVIFARRLRQEREAAGVSQVELARRISEQLGASIDPTAITRIESQERAVRLDEAVIAARALDLPLTVLLGEAVEEELDHAIQQYLRQLTEAEAAWEKARIDMQRLTTAIQALTTERDLIQRHHRG